MNDKQRRYAHEYVIDHNATQAAIRAGYSPRSAHDAGWRLLNHPEVKAEIARIEADIANQLGATKAWIVQGLVDNARTCLPRLDIDADGNEVLVGNPAAANRSLELLAKMQGMFTEKTEITHQGTVYTLHIDTALHDVEEGIDETLDETFDEE